MKYMVRSKLYKASNVEFDPNALRATSYGWWRFLDCVNGKLIFNTHGYSNTTRRHQSKVRAVLRDVGAVIDYEFDCPAGLQSPNALKSTLGHYGALIKELEEAIAKPRSKPEKNLERKAQIGKYAQAMLTAKRLLGGAE